MAIHVRPEDVIKHPYLLDGFFRVERVKVNAGYGSVQIDLQGFNLPIYVEGTRQILSVEDQS